MKVLRFLWNCLITLTIYAVWKDSDWFQGTIGFIVEKMAALFTYVTNLK